MKSDVSDNLPLIVILGPTASGKSSAGLELAQKIGGEIICADSRTVYRGMDIGTAKPTIEERTLVKHWCLDLVNPDQSFSVADFKEVAQLAINDIRLRGKYPIMVGGSGLYIDSVIFDFVFRPRADERLRQKLEKSTVLGLREYCIKNNIKLPENDLNKRHLVRAIETSGNVVKNTKLIKNVIIVGIDVEKTTIRKRISLRIREMLKQGLLEETATLYKKYNTKLEAMTANIYSIAKRYLMGEIDEEQFIDLATTRDMQLVKKQRTWFRRNPYIVWLERESLIPYLLDKLDSK